MINQYVSCAIRVKNVQKRLLVDVEECVIALCLGPLDL